MLGGFNVQKTKALGLRKEEGDLTEDEAKSKISADYSYEGDQLEA